MEQIITLSNKICSLDRAIVLSFNQNSRVRDLGLKENKMKVGECYYCANYAAEELPVCGSENNPARWSLGIMHVFRYTDLNVL